MLGQGLWIVGEFDGTSERTVAPVPGGKMFDPFRNENIRLVVNDEARTISYREGKRPDCSGFADGDVLVIGVRVRDIFQGVPQFDGRSVPIGRATD